MYMPTPCPRSQASAVAMTADHESLQIIQLDFTASRDQAPCLERGVALESRPRVEWCSASASIGRWFLRCRCELGHNSVGQLRECGLCRGRSVIDRGAGTLQRPSHSCADGANRDQGHRAAHSGIGSTAHPRSGSTDHTRGGSTVFAEDRLPGMYIGSLRP